MMDILSLIQILGSIFVLGFFCYLLMSSKKWCAYAYLSIALALFIAGYLLNNNEGILASIGMTILWLIALGEKWRRGKVNF